MDSSLTFPPHIIKIALNCIELSQASFATGLIFLGYFMLEIISGSWTVTNASGNHAEFVW